MKILVINPGGTSTKIAVFEDEKQLFKTNITHTAEDLKPFRQVFDQFAYRKELILRAVTEQGVKLEELSAVAGRGGLMEPIPGGTYAVNDRMVEDMRSAVHGEHPSNLGSVLAKEIGDELGVPSFVVDPVSVDELMPMARVSGISDLERPSWFHALNHKAVARWAAERVGKPYEACDLIVAHLGSGNSIVAHKHGRMIDGSGGRTNGPFSPERSGGLPTYPLVELCYSGKYTHKELVAKLSSVGGMYDYLGTKDAQEVEHRMEQGDEKARLVYEAYVYAIAKEICSYAAAFDGKVDRIVLTGGIAHSDYVVREVGRMTAFLAPLEVVAGEFEMEALALGALRVLRGEEEALSYP
ncbi:butyrate kinase [Intestinimonas sp.]|uniref:butyrate kinase n=1 Tax=Intestinimonas sp. TaxID=1965293 RepID=UPI002608C4F9|nr:butyrate kinase [Intestinimonas sp.]